MLFAKSPPPQDPLVHWVMRSCWNYQWLSAHALAIVQEYAKRFGKIAQHTSLVFAMAKGAPYAMRKDPQTPFVQSLPKRYHRQDAVAAYRSYYRARIPLEQWRHSEPPDWMNYHR
jgi:hypothetical protein